MQTEVFLYKEKRINGDFNLIAQTYKRCKYFVKCIFICILFLAFIVLSFHSQSCHSSDMVVTVVSLSWHSGVLYPSIFKCENACASIEVFWITKGFLSVWEYYPKYGTEKGPDMQLNKTEFHSRKLKMKRKKKIKRKKWKEKKNPVKHIWLSFYSNLLKKKRFPRNSKRTGLYPDTNLSPDILGPCLVLEERWCFNFPFLMHIGEETSYLQKTKKKMNSSHNVQQWHYYQLFCSSGTKPQL